MVLLIENAKFDHEFSLRSIVCMFISSTFKVLSYAKHIIFQLKT
jgi:hypothetical protein